MELKLNKQPLFISEMLLDTTAEQPMECDALLPDYCPDVVRILKCVVTPTIASKHCSNQRLSIEGMSHVVVYYTSTTEGIFKSEYKLPFSKSFDIKGDTSKVSISAHARVSYVNCRAVNQRRLDIRGAVTIAVKAIGCHEEMVVVNGEGAGIQMLDLHTTSNYLLGECTRDIRLEESLELTYGKPPIKEIVRCCATPKVIECKASEGKIIVKGELDIHLFYQTNGGAYDQMDFNLPTVLLIEMDGADESCIPRVCQDMIYTNMELSQDKEGENRIINLEASIMCTVKVDCTYDATMCVDCYSTKGRCGFKTKSYHSLSHHETMHELVTLRETMPLPENLETVLDLWCDTGAINFRGEKDGILADGRVTISMLAKMRDGEIYYFDKNMDMENKLPISCENPLIDGCMHVVGSGYNFTANDTIEVRCDLCLDGDIYEPIHHQAIDEIVVEDKKPSDKVMASGLYLYIMSDKEEMWDIAKKYNTSVNRIEEENPQDGQLWSKGILLIPVM